MLAGFLLTAILAAGGSIMAMRDQVRSLKTGIDSVLVELDAARAERAEMRTRLRVTEIMVERLDERSRRGDGL